MNFITWKFVFIQSDEHKTIESEEKGESGNSKGDARSMMSSHQIDSESCCLARVVKTTERMSSLQEIIDLQFDSNWIKIDRKKR